MNSYRFMCRPSRLFFRSHSVKFSTSSTLILEKERNDHILEDSRKLLYESHIPTTHLQKLLLTLGSSIISISDLYRHDMIAVLGETTGNRAAKYIRDRMLSDTEGKLILDQKPRINSQSLDFNYLKSLPADTLGHAYMSFLQTHMVTPDSRRPVTFVDDADIAFVIQRYREVHDLNHTLLSMPTNLMGEVCIKWVEAIQTGFPMCITGALFGPLRLKSKQRQLFVKTYLPWAIECGHRAKLLMNIYYEKRWDQNLSDLKQELNIPEFPS